MANCGRADGVARPEPTGVMFGAGRELTWRKLGPALYNLFLDGWLSKRFAVVGVDQTRMRDDAFRKHLLEGVDRFSRRGRTSRDANLSVAEIRRIYGLGSAENARRTTRDARKLEAISEGTSEFRRLSDDEIAGMMAKAALAVREARFWRRFGQDPKPGLRQSVQASGVLPRLVRPVFEDSRPEAFLKPPDDLCFGEERQIPRFAQHNRGGVLLELVARSPFGKRRDHEAYDTKGRGVGHVAGDRIDDWRLQSGMP